MSILDQCSNVEGMSCKNLYIYPVNTAFAARLDEESLVRFKKDLGERTYRCESDRRSSASNLLFVAEKIRIQQRAYRNSLRQPTAGLSVTNPRNILVREPTVRVIEHVKSVICSRKEPNVAESLPQSIETTAGLSITNLRKILVREPTVRAIERVKSVICSRKEPNVAESLPQSIETTHSQPFHTSVEVFDGGKGGK